MIIIVHAMYYSCYGNTIYVLRQGITCGFIANLILPQTDPDTHFGGVICCFVEPAGPRLNIRKDVFP